MTLFKMLRIFIHKNRCNHFKESYSIGFCLWFVPHEQQASMKYPGHLFHFLTMKCFSQQIMRFNFFYNIELFKRMINYSAAEILCQWSNGKCPDEKRKNESKENHLGDYQMVSWRDVFGSVYQSASWTKWWCNCQSNYGIVIGMS